MCETVPEPSAGPEQHAIDAHTTQTLRKLLDELSPRRRTVLRVLFTDDDCSYTEVARIAGIPLGGIPLGGIGPTRARALRQLRDKLDQHQMGPGA
jgi:DNA-directed RNA polymerase specialized sigma24 family protein